MCSALPSPGTQGTSTGERLILNPITVNPEVEYGSQNRLNKDIGHKNTYTDKGSNSDIEIEQSLNHATDNDRKWQRQDMNRNRSTRLHKQNSKNTERCVLLAVLCSSAYSARGKFVTFSIITTYYCVQQNENRELWNTLCCDVTEK